MLHSIVTNILRSDVDLSPQVTYKYLWMAMYACRETKCQKQSLVARAGIAFRSLESGVIEAEVGERKGDRFDGVRNGSRVASRIEDAFGISRAFDRVDDRET